LRALPGRTFSARGAGERIVLSEAQRRLTISIIVVGWLALKYI
jgi:hypothetical protein